MRENIALPWQDDSEFRELPRFGRHINSAPVLLYDDVVRHRETKAGSFTGWFGREEGIEHLFLHFDRDAGSIVANANFDGIPEVSGSRSEGRLETSFAVLRLAFGRTAAATAFCSSATVTLLLHR
jgi:hypothetical protein